jgi:hypothetical protein
MSAADERPGLAGLTAEELRAAVREVLRDVLPAAVTDRPRRAPAPDEVVHLGDDADLDAFVRRVAARCADPAERAALADGRHGYRLRAPSASQPQPEPATGRSITPAQGVTRVERGAVTERIVARVAAAGHRLVLGPRAVLTPLGRDRARSLGVTVEKES